MIELGTVFDCVVEVVVSRVLLPLSQVRMTQSATSNAPPSRTSTGSSSWRARAFALCVDSKMVIAKPTATAEPKNLATVTEGLRRWGYGE